MDFIIGLPNNFQQHDSIIFVVDKLSNSPHFILVKYAYKATNIVDIFMKEIFRLHSVTKVIILDKYVKFTGNF